MSFSDGQGVRARSIRPYTLTAGRTRPALSLPVEARLRVLTLPRDGSGTPHGRVAQVCDSRSIAEVSALLSLPIGVVRVLVGDLVARGQVQVEATLSEASSRDERRALIERTLSGLRNL